MCSTKLDGVVGGGSGTPSRVNHKPRKSKRVSAIQNIPD